MSKNSNKILKPQANQERLKSLGALISGITHEINTPMHYLENNLTFLKHSFNDLLKLEARYQELLNKARNRLSISEEEWKLLEAAEKQAEPDYLRSEIQQALEQSLEGINMVSKLVLALKDFSHPSLHDFSLIDVNKCIDTVCTISRHEWKRNADLKLELSRDLPLLFASRDELHQVFLNILVNAAHAIEEKIENNGYTRGLIKISTRFNQEQIEVEIYNDGSIIPHNIIDKIFEANFTTKKAGKGTGLGLNLVKTIVEEAHKGKILVHSSPESGTSFKVILPHRHANEVV
ncbi:MAG: hypothetical protein Kow0029_19050 [Candidatus Rifleibacteriota bacterium]